MLARLGWVNARSIRSNEDYGPKPCNTTREGCCTDPSLGCRQITHFEISCNIVPSRFQASSLNLAGSGWHRPANKTYLRRTFDRRGSLPRTICLADLGCDGWWRALKTDRCTEGFNHLATSWCHGLSSVNA